MEILKIRNRHINKIKECRCMCSNCGTVFVFKYSELSIPKAEFCTIICPNCKYVTTLDKCKEFNMKIN